MKCKDCKYFHIKEPTGYSRAFCGNWLSDVGEIKRVIRKCEYYKEKLEAKGGGSMNRPIKHVTVSIINGYINELKESGGSAKTVSDGYHTFDELYHHRMILFSIICNMNPELAWKSKQHHDGTMFDEDSFICGIETPNGQYTYHYKLTDWDYFHIRELERAPVYDGHKPKDIDRLLSLQGERDAEKTN